VCPAVPYTLRVTIESGRDLLHYRLVEQIGEGGMGVVWKGVDTTLQRDVAIKILPDEFARDPERLARFDREAKLLASLNHPNIATIHGLHREGDLRFIAMELVAGENLDQRLSRGALPLDAALRVARQVADALEAAHENGVIHRDLKPANIHVSADGDVKVLDFGLAKAFETEGISGSNPDFSPTVTSAGTVAGVILGTAAYMSPEQARGVSADRRADIWALGCVIYEMLTASKLFKESTVSDTLAAILRAEPDLNALPKETPSAIRRLLRRCLEKDRRQRLQAAGDARLEIEEAVFAPAEETEAAPGPAASRWTRILPWAVAAAMTIVAIVTISSSRSTAPVATAGVMRFTLPLPGQESVATESGSAVVLSPDGSAVVHVAIVDDAPMLVYRSLDREEGNVLAGTESARHPFFSPDGRWVGFFADNQMKKVPVRGGPPEVLATTKSDRGGAWSADGTIYFAPTEEAEIHRVSDKGGAAEAVSSFAEDGSERSHRWPALLPGGQALLLVMEQQTDETFDEADIQLFDLATGERRTLIRGGSYARYSPTGHVVYVRDGTMLAAPFDPTKLEVTGPAVPVVESIDAFNWSGGAQFSFSQSGNLIYLPKRRAIESTAIRIDRAGKRDALIADPALLATPQLSPDGRQLAVSLDSGIRVYDIERGVSTRLALAAESASPLWSLDGERIVYSSRAGGLTNDNLFIRRADGSDEPERIGESEYTQVATSWSPDGRTLLFNHLDYESGMDILLMSLEGDRTPKPFLRTPFRESDGRISPDGRWVAYSSDESGRTEIYIRSFPDGGNRIQLSTEGGHFPRWSSEGNEVFYRIEDRIDAIRIAAGAPPRISRPEIVVQGLSSVAMFQNLGRDYDVFPDASAFVALQRVTEGTAELQPRVVLNWFDELTELVPQ